MARKQTPKIDKLSRVKPLVEGDTDSAGLPEFVEHESASAIPPLHSLVAFEAIARHKSVSAAARDLGVTRSALSHSISILEHRLQVRLLRRTHPVVELTRAGESYLLAVQDFATTLGDSLYRLSPDARATLRLAVCPELARLWLGSRLSKFHDLYPRIDLNVSVVRDPECESLGRADLVMQYGPKHPDRVLVMPLWRESIVAMAAPKLAKHALEIDLRQIHPGLPLIESPQFSWAEWFQGATSRQVSHNAVLVTHDLIYGLEMAVHGMGVVLAPSRLSRHYVESGRLEVASRLERNGSYFQALTLESNANRPPISAFLGWLAGEAHDIGNTAQ